MFCCSTPDISKIHDDESSDLKVVGNVLRDVYGVCGFFLPYSMYMSFFILKITFKSSFIIT